jgi:Ca-activated chloride channel homolog
MQQRRVSIALLVGSVACADVPDIETHTASLAPPCDSAERRVILRVRPDTDARLVNKLVNTARAAGTELVIPETASIAPACLLTLPAIVVTASEIVYQGRLVATVESVLRDDSATFKVDALYEQLGAPREPTRSTETYHDHGRNPWVSTSSDWLSTFAADVDTASYTLARRKLAEHTLPDPSSVRVEEYVNYFAYAFPPPAPSSPFAVIMDAAPSPLSPGRHVVRVGVATKPKAVSQRQPAHLVFLVDVSGSMASADKLPLAQEALRILTRNLTEADTVSLVTYAGSTRVVLEPTSAKHQRAILAAIDELSAEGSTAMASGIDLAYARAVQSLQPGHTSRVIVLSDGDANVGLTSHEEMLQLIASRAAAGVTLSTIGFGMGNYNDHLMEQLADRGNGNNFYVDSLDAAERIFAEDLTATIEVVAKDVKLQVNFNPVMVSRYRLVGYENRDVADEDFRDDVVDAGEIGAGHQVTALYEVELTAFANVTRLPLGAVRIRHKDPQGTTATESTVPMVGGPARWFDDASADFRFAYAVAAFADVLRGGTDAEAYSLSGIRAIASVAAGGREERVELVGLIDTAAQLRN